MGGAGKVTQALTLVSHHVLYGLLAMQPLAVKDRVDTNRGRLAPGTPEN